MGISIQSIVGDGPKFMSKSKTLPKGWVWLVLRRDPNEKQGQGHVWHIQGVATNEELAIRMCLDEHYIIGPLPLDSGLPQKRIEWAGSYFPLAKREPK